MVVISVALYFCGHLIVSVALSTLAMFCLTLSADFSTASTGHTAQCSWLINSPIGIPFSFKNLRWSHAVTLFILCNVSAAVGNLPNIGLAISTIVSNGVVIALPYLTILPTTGMFAVALARLPICVDAISLIHRSLAIPAVFPNSDTVLATFHAVAATPVAHALAAILPVILAAHDTILAHHSTTANISLATPIGSVSNVLANASRLPYLSIIACLPSSVNISFQSPANVSAGFNTALPIPLAVFNALHGILANRLPICGPPVLAPAISSTNFVSCCVTKSLNASTSLLSTVFHVTTFHICDKTLSHSTHLVYILLNIGCFALYVSRSFWYFVSWSADRLATLWFTFSVAVLAKSKLHIFCIWLSISSATLPIGLISVSPVGHKSIGDIAAAAPFIPPPLVASASASAYSSG